MRTCKFTLFFFLFLVIKALTLKGAEIDSKLDDNYFITRVVYREVDYSFCLLSAMDSRSPDMELDFSFNSRLIRAGRVKRLGFWRELFNPLKVSAGSDLFKESPGLGKDFSFYSGGLYGLSVGVKKGTNLSILFTDNLWIGGNYTIGSYPLLIRAFISAVGGTNTLSDDWTSDFPIVPVTNPIHMGLQSILKWNILKIDYLGALSGNSIYKTGSYNRLHVELLWEKLRLKGFGGITSPDFINTDVNLAEDKYFLSLWIGFYPKRDFETIFKIQYGEEHVPVLPIAFIPTSGSSSIKIKYDNSKFLFTIKLGQKFDFDSNGMETVKNKFDSRIGVSGQLSAFIGLGFSSDFDSLTERRFELELKGSKRGTDVELVFKYKEEIFEPIDQYKLRLKVDQEFGTGSAFIKVEVGEGWSLEGLSVGFKTVFE